MDTVYVHFLLFGPGEAENAAGRFHGRGRYCRGEALFPLSFKKENPAIFGSLFLQQGAPTSNNLNKQYVLHHPDNMALPSGIYTIQNVKYRNWAMLLNANQGEVVAGSSASTNVGEKVSVSKVLNHQRRLTTSCSGPSTNWQTGLILCRINSTVVIMRLTPVLISWRTWQQFPAYGTLN
jgi:hypothetical protein